HVVLPRLEWLGLAAVGNNLVDVAHDARVGTYQCVWNLKSGRRHESSLRACEIGNRQLAQVHVEQNKCRFCAELREYRVQRRAALEFVSENTPISRQSSEHPKRHQRKSFHAPQVARESRLHKTVKVLVYRS